MVGVVWWARVDWHSQYLRMANNVSRFLLFGVFYTQLLFDPRMYMQTHTPTVVPFSLPYDIFKSCYPK